MRPSLAGVLSDPPSLLLGEVVGPARVECVKEKFDVFSSVHFQTLNNENVTLIKTMKEKIIKEKYLWVFPAGFSI